MFVKGVLLVFCFATLAFRTSENSKLNLRFEGIERAGGTVRLALYNQKGAFMDEKKAVLYNFKTEKAGTLAGTIENLPSGAYAFAVFLDENNNKKLDTNLVGVPTEPYGFSKIPPSKWRLPTWDEVRFELDGTASKTLVVNLKRWALL